MNDAQHIERVLQDAVDESDFDCIALSGGLDSTILAHLASSKNPLALAVAADGFDASDLEFSKLAAKNCNLNLKLLRPDADELADAARKTADILGNFNDIEIRNATVMYVLLSNAKKLGMHKVMTGDGADELFAGYKFMRKLNPEKLQSELDRVYSVMHFTSQIIAKDMGISIVSPFLSENVIRAAKSIAPEYKVRYEGDVKYGKWILRKAFESKIPRAISWREKAAMQDGAGTVGLCAYFENLMDDAEFSTQRENIHLNDGVSLHSKESLYYYKAFRENHKPPTGGRCPQCHGHVESNSKFCRMCGAYPI